MATIADQLSVEEFQKLARFIYSKTGIHLAEEKIALLSNRLRKRLRALSLTTYDQYYQLLLAGDDEEMTQLLNAVTTNETYFFRNDKLWDFFSNELVPNLVKEKRAAGKRDFHVWSAASSTGAEAYTVAIVLREKLAPLSDWDVRIVGSDISEKVLGAAREAKYDNYAVSRVSPARLRAAFRQEKDTGAYVLRDEVRKMVNFEFHNLRDAYRRMRFDIVLLRNVMMYFDLPMKRMALRTVTDALKPGGYLIIGDVDPIRDGSGLRDDCELDYVRPSLYRKPQ